MFEALTWATIRPVLLRLLPGVLAMLGIVGAVWWIDHAGYRRAEADRDAADAKMLVKFQADLRASEERVALAIDGIAGNYETGRTERDKAFSALRADLAKDIAHEPRLSDPAAGLTSGLLDAINHARALGPCAATASGRIECAVPGAEPGH